MQGRDFFNVGAAVMAALALTPAASMAMDAKAAVDAAKAAGATRFVFVTVVGTGNSWDAAPRPIRS